MMEHAERQRLSGPRAGDRSSPPSGRDDVPNEYRDWRSAMSLVTFSFALVLIMATALFVIVGFNPKNESYGKLPWIYAIGCLVGSALCWGISHRLDVNHV